MKKGDTLVEVSLAIGIFSMVAIAAVSVINGSTNGAQASLESTITREEIDGQAEALRFIQSAYVAGGDEGAPGEGHRHDPPPPAGDGLVEEQQHDDGHEEHRGIGQDQAGCDRHVVQRLEVRGEMGREDHSGENREDDVLPPHGPELPSASEHRQRHDDQRREEHPVEHQGHRGGVGPSDEYRGEGHHEGGTDDQHPPLHRVHKGTIPPSDLDF